MESPHDRGAAADALTSDVPARETVDERRASTGFVRDSEGGPISGATVSWTRNFGPTSVAMAEEQYWSRVRAATQTVQTDSDGSFIVDDARSQRGGLLWVSHPDYVARAVPAPLEGEIVALEPHEGATARVVNAAGAPVPNASVIQRGIREYGNDEFRTINTADPRESLELVHTTDEHGLARLHPYGGELRIFALQQGRSSPSHDVECPAEELELVMHPTFELAGTIAPFDAQVPGRPVTITVFADRNDIYLLAGRATVPPEGAFGPVSLPAIPSDNYVYFATGGDIESQRDVRPAPVAGSRVDLHFEGTRGRLFVVKVTDGSGPVVGAEVYARWGEGVLSEEEDSGEDGTALLRGCGAERVWIRADKQGYVSAWAGPFDSAPGDSPTEVEVMLRGLGTLEIRVEHEGEPVTQFDLLLWRDDPYNAEWITFEGRADGTYTLGDVEPGVVEMIAASEEHPRSEVAIAEIVSFETANVEIELPEALAGRGRVVDAATRQPVTSARIQLYTNASSQLITKWGVEHSVDENGEFWIHGFPVGDASFTVSAPGYGMVAFSGRGVAGKTIELGTLPLHPESSLELVLDRAAGPSPAGYSVTVRGARVFEEAPFDADGTLVLDGVIPGVYELYLGRPDGRSQLVVVQLEGTGPWRRELTVGGVREIEIVARRADGGILANAWVVLHQGVAEFDSWRESVATDRDGHALFTTAAVGPATVVGYDENGVEAGLASILVEDLPRQKIEVELGGAGGELRLIDVAGLPLVGASVSILCEDGSTWEGSVRTDGDGEGRWGPAPCDPAIALVRHGGGFAFGFELRSDERTEIVADFGHGARARLRDRGTPLTGLSAWLYEPDADRWVAIGHPDAGGEIHWSGLGKGTYEIRVSFPGYWPHRALVESARNPKVHDVELRRRGDLVIVVPDEAVAVSVRSLEYDVFVDEWIGDGRVTSSGFAPGAELRLAGLPNGPYAWNITLDDETTRDGEVVVAPFGEARVEE